MVNPQYIILNYSEFDKLNLEKVIYKISEDNVKIIVVYEDNNSFHSPVNVLEGPYTSENLRQNIDISYWCKNCK
jgi:hypothetical protein